MKSSILITTYNRPTYLKRAVESALAQQTWFPFEVIVVDDNGLGTTAQQETQKLFTNFFPDVRYLPLEKNSGACAARNFGADAAKGEYLFFLDDDDMYLPGKVSQQVAYLEQNPDLAGCLAAFRRMDENGKEMVSASNYAVVGDFKNFVLHGNFFTPMLCIRRKAFGESGGFISIPRFQDRFYMMHALQQGLTFGVIPDELHIMYEHSGSRVTHSSIENTAASLQQIKDYVADYRDDFLPGEWRLFERHQLNTMAVTKYNASEKKIRQSAVRDYAQLFWSQPNWNDLMMVFKSLVK
ncbi:glycosyltransferase family 2 protein [Daejeonia sp. YH14]|uniref:glycosyltransferase family 2 protein n=1 Tax=Daejeonia sp. YH14 TaxID=3439042 RepID=UPI003F49A0FF